MERDKIMKLLTNLYINYCVDTKRFVMPSYKTKCTGVMEGLLLTLGVLNPGQPFQFKKIPHKLFGFLPIIIQVKESYEDHILRLTYETIKES